MALTEYEIPDKSILDINGRQTYLANSFVASLKLSGIGNTETPVMLLTNASTNKKSLFHDVRKVSCVTASAGNAFRVYFNPTITGNGTPVTPINLRPASSTTSIANVYSSPTVSSNGTYVATLASFSYTPNVSTVLIILDPGQTVLYTSTATGAGNQIEVELVWYEI